MDVYIPSIIRYNLIQSPNRSFYDRQVEVAELL